MTSAKIKTKVVTSSRIDVLGINFALFLASANVSDEKIRKLKSAVSNKEIEAVGVYIAEDGYRICEVEYNVDWDKHQEMCKVNGSLFDLNRPGYVNGACPEARQAVEWLVDEAKKLKRPISTWIRVTNKVRQDPSKHKEVCDRLGYCFGRSVPNWKNGYEEQSWNVMHLEETNVIVRSQK